MAGVPTSASDETVRVCHGFSFLPERGGFRFPAPWLTDGVRVTNASDGTVLPCGYSYWPRVSNRGDHLIVLVGIHEHGPSLFRVETTWPYVVTPLGPIFPSDPLRYDEADQWAWSQVDPTAIYAASDKALLAIRPGGPTDVVFESHVGAAITQPHASDDGRAHSVTVQDENYTPIGSLVYRDGVQQFFARLGDYDECQIDQSGRWLLIKESSDNRIIDLETGAQRIITNANGALGHSDCGHGFVVGEDDMHDPPGRMVLLPLDGGDASLQYHLTQWHSGLGHVAVRGHQALVSNAHTDDLPRVNELVLVALDGSRQATALCPNLVDLSMASDVYKAHPFANLDQRGEWACWSANAGTDRTDLFLVRVGVASADVPMPSGGGGAFWRIVRDALRRRVSP